MGQLLRVALRPPRRLSIRVGAVVALTAFLLTVFLGHVFLGLYGESELCRQKYNLQSLSFYSGRFDCFMTVRDLATKLAGIFALAAGPLVAAFLSTAWVDWPVRSSEPGGPHLAPPTGVRCAPRDVACEAQLLFWVFTAALGVALVAGIALWAVAIWSVALNQVIGSVLFYAVHLYPAGLLAFAAVWSVTWLWRRAAAALRLPR